MKNKRKSFLLEKSDKIIREIYQKTIDFSYKYQSLIGDQLRRASLSVVLNITEAASKFSKKEQLQFLRFAFSSLKETKYLINEDFYNKSITELDSIAKLLYGIINKKT